MTHDVPPDQHGQTYGPAATGVGWEEGLRALAAYLSDRPTGEGTAPAESAGALTTPEIAELTRRCAEAWGRVDLDSGTSTTVAEARALRTAAFYLGPDELGPDE